MAEWDGFLPTHGVWACTRCGRTGTADQCQCGGSRGVMSEPAALALFRLFCEPPNGWADWDDVTRSWKTSDA